MIYNIICLLILDVATLGLGGELDLVGIKMHEQPDPQSFEISYLRSVDPSECPCRVSANCHLSSCNELEIENMVNGEKCSHHHDAHNEVDNCPGNSDVFVKETQSSRTIKNPNRNAIGHKGFGCNKHISGTTYGINRDILTLTGLRDDEMLWSFYARETTEMTIDMCYSHGGLSGYDTLLTVIRKNGDQTELVAHENDDRVNCGYRNHFAPHVSFQVEEGWEYYIKIGGYANSRGYFRMNITCEDSKTRLHQAAHKFVNAIGNLEHSDSQLPDGITLFDQSLPSDQRRKAQQLWKEVAKDFLWQIYYGVKGETLSRYAVLANLAKHTKDVILADPNYSNLYDGEIVKAASLILDVAPAVVGAAAWAAILTAAEANPAAAIGVVQVAEKTIVAFQAIDPSLRFDEQTNENVNRVFARIGGYGEFGAIMCAFIGSYGGPLGTFIGGTIGGLAGPVVGAICQAADGNYC